jgi:hypothetical protein
MTTFFHILSNSLVADYPTIWRKNSELLEMLLNKP